MKFSIDQLLSTESVKYNSNSALRKLCIGIATACVTVYKDNVEKSDKDIYRSLSDVMSESSQMMRAYTGIDLTLKVKVPDERALDSTAAYNVEVEIPKMALTPSSMYPKLSDSDMDKLLAGKTVNVVNGTMDLVTSKVSGIYSAIGFTINFGVDLFRPEYLTEEEIAAILLHEIGHIWDFLTNLGEISRATAISAYARKVMTGNYTYEKKLALVTGLGLNSDDPTSIEDDQLMTLVAMNAFGRNRALQTSVLYSKNTEEHLADSFAAMHGLAYATATAMRKLEMQKMFFLRSKEYRPVWLGGVDVVSEFTTFLSLGYGIGSGAGIMGPVVYPLVLSVIINSIPLFGEKIPVTPLDRINKMREALISALRDPSTLDSEKKLILADIKVLNGESKLMGKSLSTRGPWDMLKGFVENLVPVSKARQDFHTRNNLDSLTDNRLFEITEKLKQGL